MHYKVSVVVPIYNVEQYLEECLDSIKGQSLDNFEVILVDDGSTDSCADIISSYIRSNKGWKSIYQNNSGYGKAVNIGIDAAMGDFISIVEPDDLIAKDMLKFLYNCAVENNADIVSADYNHFFYIEGKRIIRRKNVFKDHSLYGKVINPFENSAMLKGEFINPAGVFKRLFINENCLRHNETPGAAFQDRGFLFLSLICAKRVIVLDESFYYYRQDNPNSSIAGRNDIDKVIKEYDITYDQIYAKGDSYKCFLAEHFRREFGSCLYALSRAGEEYLEYSIKEMSRAFNEYESKGFLDTSFIDEHQLCQLHEIMKKPEMAYKSFKNLGKEVSNKISGYNSFILYGAGVIGKRIFDCITDRDISKFLGFAVSNSNDIDVCAYKGYEIKAIDDYMNFRKDTAVVVAVTHKWREEICDRLDDLGFEHIIILDSMGADV